MDKISTTALTDTANRRIDRKRRVTYGKAKAMAGYGHHDSWEHQIKSGAGVFSGPTWWWSPITVDCADSEHDAATRC